MNQKLFTNNEVHKKYMDIACNRFKKSNKNIEVINDICSVTTDIYRNDGSHKYLATYRFNPDIIYLDGPDPGDILNSKFFKDDKEFLFLRIYCQLKPG